MSNFDNSDSQHPNPQRLRSQCADLLGLAHHASDDELRAAFESLLDQAGTTPDAPQRNDAIDPKVVKANLIAEGRRRLGWAK